MALRDYDLGFPYAFESYYLPVEYMHVEYDPFPLTDYRHGLNAGKCTINKGNFSIRKVQSSENAAQLPNLILLLLYD